MTKDEVDENILKFLGYQIRNEHLIINFLSDLKTLKTLIEMNIPSKYDLQLIQFISTKDYDGMYIELNNDIKDIVKLKEEILNLYANRDSK